MGRECGLLLLQILHITDIMSCMCKFIYIYIYIYIQVHLNKLECRGKVVSYVKSYVGVLLNVSQIITIKRRLKLLQSVCI